MSNAPINVNPPWEFTLIGEGGSKGQGFYNSFFFLSNCPGWETNINQKCQSLLTSLLTKGPSCVYLCRTPYVNDSILTIKILSKVTFID